MHVEISKHTSRNIVDPTTFDNGTRVALRCVRGFEKVPPNFGTSMKKSSADQNEKVSTNEQMNLHVNMTLYRAVTRAALRLQT